VRNRRVREDNIVLEMDMKESVAETSAAVNETVESVAAKGEEVAENVQSEVKSTVGPVSAKVQEIYEQHVSGKYEDFKKCYPQAKDTLEQAERVVVSAVSTVTEQSDRLVEDLDKRIHKQYETKLKGTVDSVSETVDSVRSVVVEEANRKEVVEVRSSVKKLWDSVLALISMYIIRGINWCDNFVDDKLPSTSTIDKVKSAVKSDVNGEESVVEQFVQLCEKVWLRSYSRLATKAKMEPKEVRLRKSNVEDIVLSVMYAYLVICVGFLTMGIEKGKVYDGVLSGPVHIVSSVAENGMEIVRPMLPGTNVKTE